MLTLLFRRRYFPRKDIHVKHEILIFVFCENLHVHSKQERTKSRTTTCETYNYVSLCWLFYIFIL